MGGRFEGRQMQLFFFHTSSQVSSKVRDHGGGGKGVSGYGEAPSAAYQECLKSVYVAWYSLGVMTLILGSRELYCILCDNFTLPRQPLKLPYRTAWPSIASDLMDAFSLSYKGLSRPL